MKGHRPQRAGPRVSHTAVVSEVWAHTAVVSEVRAFPGAPQVVMQTTVFRLSVVTKLLQ